MVELAQEQERALIERARQGDREAYSFLVRAYQGRIMKVVSGLVHNREDAQDAAQDVFVKAWRNLKGFQGGSSFYTWLYRIAVNVCIDQHRRRKTRAAESLEFEDQLAHGEEGGGGGGDFFHYHSHDMNTPARVAQDRELAAHLYGAIEDLSDKHRQVLLLREVDGLSYEDIAQQVGCHLGTVMSRLFHARKRIQQALAPYWKGTVGARQGGSHE
jgi:RNA polymerase sigma-70 factor (ECF subfamily)